PDIPKPNPPMMLVGSAWNTFLTSPVEPGNFANYSHVDTGFVVATIEKFQIEPYVAANTVKDTKGFQWNNRVEGEAGLKIVRPFRNGMIDFGAAFADEYRASASGGLKAQDRAGLKTFTDGWFGWDQPTNRSSERKFFS